jgi:hypothetical protein
MPIGLVLTYIRGNKMNPNKSVRIDILKVGVEVFSTTNHGQIMVTEFYNKEEIGGGFFDTLEEAYKHVEEYLNDEENKDC